MTSPTVYGRWSTTRSIILMNNPHARIFDSNSDSEEGLEATAKIIPQFILPWLHVSAWKRKWPCQIKLINQSKWICIAPSLQYRVSQTHAGFKGAYLGEKRGGKGKGGRADEGKEGRDRRGEDRGWRRREEGRERGGEGNKLSIVGISRLWENVMRLRCESAVTV